MKVIEVDDGRVMSIGSMNQDHWSHYCNNEANVLITAKEGQPRPAYLQFSKTFERLKKEARIVDPMEEYGTMGYIENQFWKFFLYCSTFVGRHR